jgi:hypothetical protein
LIDWNPIEILLYSTAILFFIFIWKLSFYGCVLLLCMERERLERGKVESQLFLTTI